MTSQPQAPDNSTVRFIPLMVRFVTPINLILVVIAVIGVFLLSNSLGGNVATVEQNLLVQTAVQVAESTQAQYNNLLQEAQRIAFTQGIPNAIQANDAETLQVVLDPLATTANLDSVILLNTTGQEIIGLLNNPDANAFSLSTNTDLSTQPIVDALRNTDSNNTVGLIQTPNGSALYVASEIIRDNNTIGIVLAGRYLNTILDTISTDSLADLTAYAPDATLLTTTIELDTSNQTLASISPDTIDQTLSNSNQVTLADGLSVDEQTYRSAYIPFSVGEQTLGVISVLMPDNVAFATSGGRQISAFLMAAIAGAVTFAAAIVVQSFTRRVETVTETVDQLAEGENVRVDMQPTDEIGEMATAVNRYADVVQQREDQFRTTLHRFRRERDYLLLAFEAIPEGVIVQDTEGRVLLMNDTARDLLGSQRVYRSAGIHELTELVSESLGNNIAPGLYALGNPQRIPLDEKMLLAQASAIVVSNGQRLGSVVLLRDITDDVRRDQVQEEILLQMIDDVQVSLQDTSRRAIQNRDEIVRSLARDVAKHASTLQSMIVEMRELTRYSQHKAQRVQRSISLETLVWAIANDWRQIARANDMTLNVIIEQRGLFILGDEQRLRYAIGNVIDNAIKYNQNEGKLSIEIRGEGNGMARLRVRDSGVGIRKEDRDNLFVRYYRGHPTKNSGEIIHVPGMGQGLTDAQQIIQAHGGSIRIKTKVGVGTAVYVELPITSDTAYQLPLLEDDAMEGETMLIPEEVDAETFWDNDEL